ncbi:MAG TPA: hypothetical protein VKI20_02760, partial [Acidimicrobiales bacterium]|nr:hypothetical protein [Acidimicrobiales bacterium]
RLYVTNLKGIGAGPGPNGQAEPFSGSRTQGTVSAIDVPSDPASSQLTTWTNTVVENNNWGSLFANTGVGPCQGAPADSPLCLASVDANYRSQLHAIFIVKENKTFDQYFGDIAPLVPNADADPTWLLYGMPVTTNQHLLAQRYTISDHFWADSEQSTTGHKWTSAGYATEHDEITWNTEYDQGLRGDRSDGQYDGQLTGPKDQNIADQEGAIDRPTSRLVDSTEGAGLSTRVYSDDVNPGSKVLANGDRVPQEAWGIGPSNSNHGRDLDFPDSDRANIFLHGSTTSHEWSLDKTGAPPSTYGTTIALCGAPQADPKTCSGGASVPDGSTPYQHFSLDAWTAAYNACNPNHDPALDAGCQKAMPQYLYVALPVDHTLGFNPQSPTPASMVADNDYSVGKIIDALSHSPFWSNTVVFITEDDTQASGDHVDSHRTFLLTAGGLAHHATAGSPTGSASHQQGSFPSVLKTVEVLLGVPQLTIYDTAAQPLDSVLVAHASDAAGTPSYTAVASPTAFFVLDGSLPPTNPPGTTLAQLSALMDWRLDRTSPQLVRDVLYAGIRGWPLPSRDLALLNR